MKHLRTKFDRTLNADPVNPMWAPMSTLGPEIWGFEAGLGVISSQIQGGGSAELGRGEGLTKSQLGLPLFLIMVKQCQTE